MNTQTETPNTEEELREEILKIGITRKELDRLYWALGFGGFILLSYMRRTNINTRQIAQLRNWAGATSKYLEQRESIDGFVNHLAKTIAIQQTPGG